MSKKRCQSRQRRAKRGRGKFFGDFKRTVEVLKERIPPLHPVRVSRVKLEEDAGDCELIGNRFYIRVDKRLSKDAAILILLHEWAHSLAWHAPNWLPGEEDHHAAWGMAYSRVYETWLESC